MHVVTICKGQNEVGVNNVKGVLSVTVPLSEWKIRDFETKVSLVYTAKSVKVKSSGNEDLPVGWTLNAGGSIERILKGLPDEYQKVGDNRQGWMNIGIHRLAQSFQISDDNDPNTCPDEAKNRTSIMANWGYTLDSEPDWFVVAVPGLTCKLILDNNNTFRAVPAQDLKIEFLDQNTINPYFVITKTDGVKYTFRTNTKTTKQLSKVYTNSNLDIFNREYEHFKTPLTYINTWYLDKITTAGSEHNSIIFDYSERVVTDSDITQSTVSSLSTGSNTFADIPVYTTITSNPVLKRLSTIKSSNGQSLSITWVPTLKFDLTSSGNISTVNVHTSFLGSGSRNFLNSITETSNNCTSVMYSFEYHGYTPNRSLNALPNGSSNKYDVWGYYNNLLTRRQLNVFPGISGTAGIYRPYQIDTYSGENYSLNGSDPVIDEASITSGMQSKITYPNGGSSYFEYESNSFWDQDGNVEIKGSGARIKKITHFDGISPTKAKVIEYAYHIPGQSRTSGTIKSLPQIALTTNYFAHPNNSGATLSHAQVLGLTPKQSANYWKYLTLINDSDLSEADQSVSYQYVTVKEQGNGRTEYKYSIPSHLWTTDNNSLVYPAMDCSAGKAAVLPVRKGFGQYPFPPKEDLEYAEGLILEMKSFSETNVPVKTDEYEYENYSNSPQQIYGLAFDNLYGNLLFGRYAIAVNAKVLKREKETVYDTGVSGNSTFAEVLYDNSGPNRTVRSKTLVNSDNIIVRTDYFYSGDFNISAGQVAADPFAEGVYLLNQNYMKTALLEEIVKKQDPGSAGFKAYNSRLSLYAKNALTSLPVLTEKKGLVSVNGLSGYTNLSFNGTSLSYNPTYKSLITFSNFDIYDTPATLTENRMKKSFAYFNNIQAPFATFYGCEISNVAFTGFEGKTGNLQALSFTSSDFTTDSHTGNSAGILRNGNKLFQNFVKSSGSQSYTISFWAKSSIGGNVAVQINNSVPATISISNADKYIFYQKNIDVSSIPDNSTVTLTSSSAVKIDDIGFCSQDVQYEMTTYNYPAGKASETNSSGKTIYNEYDGKGRLTYVRDAEKNIIQYKSYHSYNSTITLSAGFGPSDGVIPNSAVFNTGNFCIAGVKYNWNFGDGTTLETYDPQVSHTFADGGPYIVKLTAYHPYYGTRTSSRSYKTALRVGTCVAGLVRKDLCNKQPATYGDCSASYLAPPSGGTVYINTLGGCPPGTTYQYQWQTRVNDIWYSVGSNQNKFSVGEQEGIHYIRCLVTSSFGTSAYSEIVVINYYRSENCPVRED